MRSDTERMNAAVRSSDPLGLVHAIFERKYRVERLVAEGGFGIVYKAWHLALDVPVALKILRPALRKEPDAFAELMSQFLKEASILSRLRGASVVAVMDAGVSSLGGPSKGLPWITLEWLEGETLKDHLARRRGQGGRTPAECMELLRPVIEAIAEAHELNIVHRDIKPSNILLVPVRGGVSPRVLDFGIAKIMAPDGGGASRGETATDSRQRAFTALSAAPEQLSGARTGPWTDVYALGLLLTELLSDRPPVAASDTDEHYRVALAKERPTPDGAGVATEILSEPPSVTAHDANEAYRVAFAEERPTPGRLGIDVGPWEAVLTRALAVRPSDRQRDARALLDELEAALASAASTVAGSASAASTGAGSAGAASTVAGSASAASTVAGSASAASTVAGSASAAGTAAGSASAMQARPLRARFRRLPVALAALGALILVGGSGVHQAISARRDAPVVSAAQRPVVIVSEFRARASAADEPGTRRLAATFAELLSEQLRIGDGVILPDANTRVAMLQASGLDADDPAVTPALLTRLRAATGADLLVVGGEISDDRGGLAASIELYDGSSGDLLTRISLSQPASDVNALIREAGARVRRSLGRPPLSAEDETALLSTLPESAEASMVYVEGLSAMRGFRYRDAADRFEQAHRLAPRFAPALAALTSARLRLGEHTRAQEAAEEAVRLAASLRRADELAVHALAAETRHDWATAVDDYRALVRFYPDRVDYVTSLARAFVGVGKALDAIELLEDARQRREGEWDRMRIELMASYAHARKSQDPASMAAAREAERLASKLGARVPLAQALFSQANGLLRAGRLDEAEALFERARAVYVEVKDDGSLLNCDAGLAEIALARGEIDRAIAIGEKIVAAHRASGNLYRLARETVGLGIVHANAGRLTTARGLFDEGGRMFIEARDREGEAFRLTNLAAMDLMLGRLDGVADKLRQGRAIHHEIGHTTGVADADAGIALLAWYEGRLADAEAAYETAYAEAVEAKHADTLAAIAIDRARLAFERKSPAEGARFEDAAKAAAAASNVRLLAFFDVLAARRALARRDAREALTRALSAEANARKARSIEALVLALAVLLDVTPEGREARRAELIAELERNEAAEPEIEALLSLGRASTGGDAAAFAERAHEAARSRGLVVLAAAARRQLARVRQRAGGDAGHGASR